MNHLATPFLYRVLDFKVSGDLIIEPPNDLLSRLLHDVSTRCLVQEIFVSRGWSVDRHSDYKDLSELIESLPNLRQVRLEFVCDLNAKYMTSIQEHPRKPELHLLAEQAENQPAGLLPHVRTIKVCGGDDYPFSVETHPPPAAQNFLKYITSYPNLKSCSWAAQTLGGRTSDDQTLLDFEGLGTHNNFPFLEHLALDGQYIGAQMCGWEDHFNWSSLSSLNIGPREFSVPENLKLMTGRLSNLKNLKVKISHQPRSEELCRSLECFLMSFDTLAQLELFNCFVLPHAICRHTHLMSLVVHIGETWKSLEYRAAFESDDLSFLDAQCPRLENLELDIERDLEKKEWPHDVLETFACGFSNLRSLTLHSRVGSLIHVDTREYHGQQPFKPKLTYKAGKEMGSQFFATRHRNFNANSGATETSGEYGRLQRFTLKAGLHEELPCQSRIRTMIRDAQLNTLTFNMLPPKTLGEEPELFHLERENQEKLCENSLESTPRRVLQEIVSIAEDGPRFPLLGTVGGKTQVQGLTQNLTPLKSLRSADTGSRCKSELAQYFHNYNQTIRLEGPKSEFLAAKTTHTMSDVLSQPLPTPKSDPTPFGNPILDLHDCTKLSLPFLLNQDPSTTATDPLNEVTYFRAA
ncbi:hypothetical protein PENNAL_c0046G05617 [Penicillium nalgiovense]|uniref:F-box domain-containing protein n=1 Tax=Penicillium nalgiovense TaxID=60175 RepID=A0A1V6XZ45_PENNA|nr:hypothetical protein PENNAL_c0046G05617 [Penicillium nalgiovense]